MGNFDRGGRGGFGSRDNDRGGSRGGFGGGRDGGRGGFGGGRDGGRSEMFKATCADCGKACEVPFRPTGERPVYCSECFRAGETSPFAPRDNARRDFEPRGRDDRGSRNDRGGRDMLDMGERPMFKATCADCGKPCEVPFRPNTDRPVYCSDCFVTDENRPSKTKKSDDSKGELEKINFKLDKILKALSGLGVLKAEPALASVVEELESFDEQPLETTEEAPVKKARKPKKEATDEKPAKKVAKKK